MGISNPTGRKFEILGESFKTARFKSASEPNFALHVTGVETIEEYSTRFPAYGPNNPLEEVYSYAQQDRMIARFGAGIWEKHHLAERRVSRALGMTDKTLQDTSPAINLPTRAGGGYKSMSADELATYRAKFGRDPVTHRGPNGIVESIEGIFDGQGFPYKQTLTSAQQQTLINELHVLYAQDARFQHLKLWPATRDWLRRHFSGGSLQIPD